MGEADLVEARKIAATLEDVYGQTKIAGVLRQFAEEIERLREVERLSKEYIVVLQSECEELAVLSHSHGWRSLRLKALLLRPVYYTDRSMPGIRLSCSLFCRNQNSNSLQQY